MILIAVLFACMVEDEKDDPNSDGGEERDSDDISYGYTKDEEYKPPRSKEKRRRVDRVSRGGAKKKKVDEPQPVRGCAKKKGANKAKWSFDCNVRLSDAAGDALLALLGPKPSQEARKKIMNRLDWSFREFGFEDTSAVPDLDAEGVGAEEKDEKKRASVWFSFFVVWLSCFRLLA
jgi:hypothetical protein